MTYKPVNQELTDVIENYIPDDFEFRENQLQVVDAIVTQYKKDPESAVLLHAPTGSGKSMIAFMVSMTLNEMDKEGYLITATKNLQAQYKEDIDKYRFPIASISGAGNYTCTENNEKVKPSGECKVLNVKPKDMACYHTCPYYSARDMAAKAPTVATNYSYWLLMMNLIYAKSLENPDVDAQFTPRDFTIFDEAHNIDSIVQDHFAPRIDDKLMEHVGLISRQFQKARINKLNHQVFSEIDKEVNRFISNRSIDLDNMTVISNFTGFIIKLADDSYAPYVRRKYKPGTKLPKVVTDVNRAIDIIRDVSCKFNDYIKIIEDFGIDNVVKINGLNDGKVKSIETSYINRDYLQKWSKFRIFMTATPGDYSKFCGIIATGKAGIIRLPESFDFSKSPIICNTKYNVTRKTMDTALPKLASDINKILDKHENQRGIIHTSSYSLMFDLSDKIVGDRVITYHDSNSKNAAIEKFKETEDGVLMGPSLTEGLDLPGDLCRFNIIGKIPYPSLGDAHIKKRMEKDREWYRWMTYNHIQQAIGRGVRFNGDQCVTYIMDGCIDMFNDLLVNDYKGRLIKV